MLSGNVLLWLRRISFGRINKRGASVREALSAHIAALHSRATRLPLKPCSTTSFLINFEASSVH